MGIYLWLLKLVSALLLKATFHLRTVLETLKSVSEAAVPGECWSVTAGLSVFSSGLSPTQHLSEVQFGGLMM